MTDLCDPGIGALDSGHRQACRRDCDDLCQTASDPRPGGLQQSLQGSHDTISSALVPKRSARKSAGTVKRYGFPSPGSRDDDKNSNAAIVLAGWDSGFIAARQ